MSFAAPPPAESDGRTSSRLRAFLGGRTGVALGLMVAGALVAATAFALVDDGNPAPTRRPTTPAARVPKPKDVPVGAFFGAHTKTDEDSIEEAKAATVALEERLRRKLDIDHNFYPWDEEFPTDLERWNLDHGRIPMISWNGRGAYTSDIAAGEHDPLILDRALRVKDLGQPVLIRWFWEMDGNKKQEWAESPQDYIAAWRHIVDLFEAEGATNVSWVWCPNASAFVDGEAQAFYPGDDYVDWVCADGYNWAPGREGDEWESFSQIFGGFYAWATQQKKPIMVGEFGVQEGTSPGAKAAWVKHLQDTIKTEFPLIRAVVYFNANQDYDWRMSTSDASYEAFREMANDPWFTGTLPRLLPR